MGDIQLERVKASDSRYKAIRSGHYVADCGTVGRALHYLIHYNSQVVGIISGASSTFSSALHDPLLKFEYARLFDKFFADEEDEVSLDRELLVSVINNSVFRLTYNEYGLASRVLAVWREIVQDDWLQYGDAISCWDEPLPVYAFETFIQPRDHENGKRRDGGCYRFDGWKYAGKIATGKLRYIRKNERFLEWLRGEECLIPYDLHEVLEEMYLQT
jgi:hypothetical protein